MMSKEQISSILSGFYIFSELTDDRLERVAENCQLQEVAKGETVIGRGDFSRGLYILVQGQLKLAVTSAYGGEKVISIISPGDSFGEAVLFLERKFPVCAEATADAQVLVVPKDVIFSLLENDASVARKMLTGLSALNHQLISNIEVLSLQSCTQRFIGYLLQISADASGAANLKLPTSKRILASLLNSSPETLSRTISKLRMAGLIRIKGKNVTIMDAARLRKFGHSAIASRS
ncbi:CRP-like cAMP-activated global transcriptional regulator [Methylophilaceae bacterium]|nr:CRP-like cAMP-activated global transcriptional regulator [Methylophilaceae bacterium]